MNISPAVSAKIQKILDHRNPSEEDQRLFFETFYQYLKNFTSWNYQGIDPSDSEEIASDAIYKFMVVGIKNKKVATIPATIAYMKKTCKNRVTDRARKKDVTREKYIEIQKRKQTIEGGIVKTKTEFEEGSPFWDLPDYFDLENPPDRTLGPEIYDEIEIQKVVYDIMRTHHWLSYKLLELSEKEGLAPNDIAVKLAIKGGNIYTYLSRARLLREKLFIVHGLCGPEMIKSPTSRGRRPGKKKKG